MEVFTLYQMATTYQNRPSELIGVDDPWLAFQFDRAIFLFGRAVENRLQERKNIGTSKKPRYVPKYTLQEAINEVLRKSQKRNKGLPSLPIRV